MCKRGPLREWVAGRPALWSAPQFLLGGPPCMLPWGGRSEIRTHGRGRTAPRGGRSDPARQSLPAVPLSGWGLGEGASVACRR
eukprot:107720-Alexandrium_andersonii.AAC.1